MRLWFARRRGWHTGWPLRQPGLKAVDVDRFAAKVVQRRSGLAAGAACRGSGVVEARKSKRMDFLEHRWRALFMNSYGLPCRHRRAILTSRHPQTCGVDMDKKIVRKPAAAAVIIEGRPHPSDPLTG